MSGRSIADIDLKKELREGRTSPLDPKSGCEFRNSLVNMSGRGE